jgi:ABC-type multidrug transport system ATPase subunit
VIQKLRRGMSMLDERTSWIEPNGLDEVWKFLIDLSRDQGITIFILTPEGSRYEHISSIDSGRMLTPDGATNLVRARESEDVFIRLEKEPLISCPRRVSPFPMVEQAPAAVLKKIKFQLFSLRRPIMSLGVVCRSAETARRALVVLLEQLGQITWFKRSGHEARVARRLRSQQTVKEMPMKQKLQIPC